MLERIGFLLDEDATPRYALLNPESVRLRRQSGLRVLHDRPGTIAGAGAADDPVIPTSGGRTEIEIDLLFDVDLLQAPTDAETRQDVDVRELTGPIWSLSENRRDGAGPVASWVIWGQHLSVRVVVEAVAERLERFDAAGIPRRSYLSLRMLRVAEPAPTAEPLAVGPVAPVSTAQATPRAPLDDEPGTTFHEVMGGSFAGPDGPRGERLDEVAARYYGQPAYWRHLAAVNGIDDLPWVTPGRILVIPPIELLAAPPAEEPDAESGVTSIVEVALDALGGSASTDTVVRTVAAGAVGEVAR